MITLLGDNRNVRIPEALGARIGSKVTKTSNFPLHCRSQVEGQEEYVPTSVLVIDDDAVKSELLKDILELKDFCVFTAHSSTEGMETIQRSSPDIVVLDLYLPETDGWQICRSIREFSPVPILVLSALNKPGAVAEALDEGADDYLVKPVPGGILIAHLNNLARRARAEREAAARSEIN